MNKLLVASRIFVCLFALTLPVSAGIIDNPGAPAPLPASSPTGQPSSTSLATAEDGGTVDTSVLLLLNMWAAVQSILP